MMWSWRIECLRKTVSRTRAQELNATAWCPIEQGVDTTFGWLQAKSDRRGFARLPHGVPRLSAVIAARRRATVASRSGGSPGGALWLPEVIRRTQDTVRSRMCFRTRPRRAASEGARPETGLVRPAWRADPCRRLDLRRHNRCVWDRDGCAVGESSRDAGTLAAPGATMALCNLGLALRSRFSER